VSDPAAAEVVRTPEDEFQLVLPDVVPPEVSTTVNVMPKP